MKTIRSIRTTRSIQTTRSIIISKTVLAACIVATVSFSGCTRGASPLADSKKAPTKSSLDSGVNATVAIEAILPGVKVQPGTSADGFQGARADIEDLVCQTDGKGVWTVSGNVKNATASSVKYRIYTSFLSGTETLGLVEADLDNVKVNQTKPWSSSMNLDAEKVDCVLRVERVNR
jgi:hypothetical protein